MGTSNNTGNSRDMIKARDAEHKRLRDLALSENPHLDGDALAARIRELETDKLRTAGKIGRATQQRNADLGRLLVDLHPDIRKHLIDLLTLVDALDPKPVTGSDA